MDSTTGTTVQQIAQLLGSLASVLWPLIVLFIVVRFTPGIRSIIESARSRRFTLRIGGQELTMEEVNQQQQSLIADLQGQVVQLHSLVRSGTAGAVDRLEGPGPARDTDAPPAVLWVDDNPKNNSYFVQQLTDAGIRVDLALSTAEGLRRADQRAYRVIISDMGRTEEGIYNRSAGLDFLEEIRKQRSWPPVVIYSSQQRAFEERSRADALGARAITASPTVLSGILRDLLPEWSA